MNTDKDPSQQSPLGKHSTYKDQYAPELLFPIPRQIKRDELNIQAHALPFTGVDVWNAYELSWLNTKGKPVVAVGEFRVPADSPCIVESKSLKLYLNSLNQTRFDGVNSVVHTLEQDLSAAAGSPVQVRVLTLSERPEAQVHYPEGVLLDDLDIEIAHYEPDPSLLKILENNSEGLEVSQTFVSHLLKSNCLVTGQPDWGTVVIRYRGAGIDPTSLLRYIVSFRQHNEFHEQCVERMFCDILRQCAPSSLSVYARYTRRGGLDINPFRTSGEYQCPENLREIRQ